ncbi:MAG: DNA primase, partial [Candidatus Omnitrophota bacterium]
GYFDFFRGRIIYPIFDLRERIIGFGGRVLDDTLPKYINTPETVVYKKGENLYGLNLSREYIRDKGFVIIVEGYMDLISSFQVGFNNLVASLGTALTPEQVRLLKRYTSSVVVLYDGDKAGELAALRGLEVLLEGGLEVKLAVLPSGFDPDSFVREKGKEEFEKIIKEARNILEYKLEILLPQYNLKSIEGKVNLIKEMLPTLAKIDNHIMLSEFVKQLADKVSVSEESIWAELKKGRERKRGFNIEKGSLEERIPIFSSLREAEITLLRLILKEKSLVREARSLMEEDFLSPEVKKIVNLLFTLEEGNKPIEPSRIVSYLGEGFPNKMVTRLLMEEDSEEAKQDYTKIFSECVQKLREDKRRKTCERLREEIALAQKEGNLERLEELLREFNAIACGRK